ncbi:STY0301 family protein [Sphingomonas jatrophae]|uniref:Uncharacterized protein n=1 Tax=Sphingomonas jatrophae TaxID=1166337 RepID=A0A1I6M1W8_9SPHN|nr:STY0301 family protein [Sphingomonas jatrophae]SFS09681.1 hypothetical protein SAMN05192580_3313 [Sphingomonas jatrophae]
MPTLSRSSARRALLGAVLAAAGATVACAAPGTAPAVAPCPARIDTQQSAAAPGGWSVDRTGSTKPLAEIGFFEGAVTDKVQLAPSSEGKGPRGVSTWRFTPRQPVRIACIYRGTDVVLSRPLPAGVRTCSITADPRSPIVRPDALSCR